jgi:hypothetical protein
VSERELDELYGLPLDEFTPARNELAKRLKSEGRSDEADEVKALRKPTVAVWLVNRLARERELDVRRLIKAGEALAEAQTSGGDFAEARREEHRVLGRLAQAARELAAREGVGTGAIERAMTTLRAAALSEEGRQLLEHGRLREELEPPGFEALAGVAAVAPRKKAPAKDDRAERKKALERAREHLRDARAEERELDAALRAAEREADKLRRKAEEAAERVAEAEAEVEQLS